MEKQIHGLNNWVKHISQMELPALGNVLKELVKLTDDSEVHIKDLADVILKDSAMTSQVLRVSNSAQYSPYGQNVATISKAIINIGFNEVRSISLSFSVIDTLMSKNPRLALLEVISRSFHAATQAKNLAFDLPSEEREEVFVAALLFNLGEMAFKGCELPQVQDYLEKIRLQPGKENEICREILDTSFRQITTELAKVWDLGTLLQSTLKRPAASGARKTPVILGEKISRFLKLGWNSPEMKAVLKESSKYTGLGEQETKQLIVTGSREARSTAATYGAEKVSHLIPEAGEHSKEATSSESSSNIQLEYMRELTNLTMHDKDINKLLRTLVNAIHFGVTLKRVVIALYDIDRKFVEARYLAGEKTDQLRKSFRIPVDEHATKPTDLFAQIVIDKAAFWLDKKESNQSLRSKELATVLATGDCFAAPLIANQRMIGVLYADNDNAPLNEMLFNEFRLFSDFANMSLSLLTKK